MVRSATWTLLFFCDALLLLLFSVGYLAAYLPPEPFWWADLIAVTLPYLSVALLVGAVLALLARRWRLGVVHALLLLLAVLRFFPEGWLEGAEAAEPEEVLTLMTFNIPRWAYLTEAAQRDAMLSLVQAERPHLVALQEAEVVYPSAAEGQLRAAPYVRRLKDSLGYQIADLPRTWDVRTNQPVLSRIDVVEQMPLQLGGKLRASGVLLTRLQFVWQGRQAVLYNLHLRSFGEQKPWREFDGHPFDPRFWLSYLRQYRRAFHIRAEQARLIRNLLEKETLPMIVCGDFNSTPHNWVYHHLRRGLSLRDAYRTAGRGWGATYHARLPFARIDFVLASPAWEVVSAHVPDVVLSDHRPLVAQLRLKE